jgi:hypothetical protein
MKISSRDTGDVESGFDDAGSRRSGEVAMRQVVAQRRRDRDSHAHLVSQDEVVYAGDCPAISDDRIQLFRTQHNWLTYLRQW